MATEIPKDLKCPQCGKLIERIAKPTSPFEEWFCRNEECPETKLQIAISDISLKKKVVKTKMKKLHFWIMWKLGWHREKDKCDCY